MENIAVDASGLQNIVISWSNTGVGYCVPIYVVQYIVDGQIAGSISTSELSVSIFPKRPCATSQALVTPMVDGVNGIEQGFTFTLGAGDITRKC